MIERAMPIVIGLIIGAALGALAATGAAGFVTPSPATVPAVTSPLPSPPADRTIDV